MDLVGSAEEMRNKVKEKLKNDWVIVYGDKDQIRTLEEEVYPPGTEENGKFGLVLSGRNWLFVGKKTDKLRDFLNDPLDFDRTIGLEAVGFSADASFGKIADIVGNTAAFIQKVVKEGREEDGINQLLDLFFSNGDVNAK